MSESRTDRRKAAARKARLRKQRITRVAVTACLMLVVCVASIGGTLAWLQATTETVTNTFAAPGIELKLTEENPGENISAKLVPGVAITKDPKVYATCDVPYYVFVKITEKDWPSEVRDDITYTINAESETNTDEKWTALEDNTAINIEDGESVYYLAVTTGGKSVGSTTGSGDNITYEGFSILENDKVQVSENLTAEDLAKIDTNPTLAFKAYAIQMQDGGSENSGNFTPVEAWNKVSEESSSNQ